MIEQREICAILPFYSVSLIQMHIAQKLNVPIKEVKQALSDLMDFGLVELDIREGQYKVYKYENH